MFTKWNKWWAGALAILIIATVLRLWNFGTVPYGLNRDEAALAYNAYSIWETGHDEHGVYWPVSILSFGDQKLPGYVYALAPLVGTLGLHNWVVRLPSLVAGILNIFLLGRILLHLTPTKKTVSPVFLSLMGMLIMAVSPWAIHFSRVAYEANLATFFFLGGFLSFLVALNSPLKSQRWLLPLIALGMNLSLLTYHSYQVFIPILLVGVLWIYRKKILAFDRRGLALALVITSVTFVLFWQGGILQANTVKGSGLALITGQNLALAYTPERAALRDRSPIIQKLLANKVTSGITLLSQNVIEVWSPGWLFVSGSEHPIHNPGGMNNLPLWSFPLILLGCIFLWNNRQISHSKILFIWLLVASFVPALTIVPQHTTRAIALFPLLTILASLGMAEILTSKVLPKKLWKISGPVFFAIIFWSTVLSFARYQHEYTRLDVQARQDHYHSLAKTLAKYQSQSYQVITQSPSSSPYIWYLLETRYDPAAYQHNHENYPVDAEGFVHVKRIDNIFFETLSWDDVDNRAQNGVITLILKPGEMPASNIETDRYQHQEDIKNDEGKTEYEVWQRKNN